MLPEDGEIHDWHLWKQRLFHRSTGALRVLHSDGSLPQSLPPMFSSRRSVAFFEVVFLDPTEHLYSELQIYYIMESFPGLTCIYATTQKGNPEILWRQQQSLRALCTCSGWRCGLSPVVFFFFFFFPCVSAVFSTSCFSLRLAQKVPK